MHCRTQFLLQQSTTNEKGKRHNTNMTGKDNMENNNIDSNKRTILTTGQHDDNNTVTDVMIT